MTVSKRNYTIDLVRLLMAILIVSMHSNFFWEINQYVSYLFTNVFARLAVPFFSYVAGIFFFGTSSELRYSKTLRRYALSYCVWSVIYFTFLSVVRAMSSETLSFWYCFRTFLFHGFYHLWYMLACIYTILLLWLFSGNKNTGKILYKFRFSFLVIGIVIFGYRNAFTFVTPFLASIGISDVDSNIITNWLFCFFPFFMSGYKQTLKKNSFLYDKCEVLLPVCILAYVFEIVLGKLFGYMGSTILCIMTYPVVYLLILFADKHPQLGSEIIAKYASGISSLMYFGHILFVLLLQKEGISETPTFFVTLLITASVGAFIVKSNNGILKRLI